MLSLVQVNPLSLEEMIERVASVRDEVVAEESERLAKLSPARREVDLF
jgi:hypothetical protein